MIRKPMSIALALIILLSAAPALSALAASAIAAALGCELNEGAIRACTLSGREIGGMLYTMLVAGWLSLISLPLGMIALVVWGIVALILKRRSAG